MLRNIIQVLNDTSLINKVEHTFIFVVNSVSFSMNNLSVSLACCSTGLFFSFQGRHNSTWWSATSTLELVSPSFNPAFVTDRCVYSGALLNLPVGCFFVCKTDIGLLW